MIKVNRTSVKASVSFNISADTEPGLYGEAYSYEDRKIFATHAVSQWYVGDLGSWVLSEVVVTGNVERKNGGPGTASTRRVAFRNEWSKNAPAELRLAVSGNAPRPLTAP